MRTSLYSILCIVIRLGAVVLAVSTLASVLSVALLVRQGMSLFDLSFVIGMLIAALVIVGLLWLYPGPLARLCSARSAGQIFESPITAYDLQWIAFSVLGMYFVVGGVVGLLHFELNQLVADTIVDREKRIEEFVKVGLYWLLQIAIGLVLVLGARGLAGLLHRLRYGAASARDDASASGER